jgi:hypothetical protein
MEENKVDAILLGIEPKPREQEVRDEIVEKVEDKNIDMQESKDSEDKEVSQEYGDKPSSEDISNVDEYGTEIPKAKVYTEEEVQGMIRDRLKRVKNHEELPVQQQSPPVKQAVNDVNEEGEENWEQQLESVVERTISKVQNKHQEEQQRQKEYHIQQEFEEKFTTGMNRYSDFNDVVSDKPITNPMMMATRSMKDPAAFIYAASKTHPKELERISKIQDPYQQVAEMGRLDERMKKARTTTSSSRPLNSQKGDVPNINNANRSIDELILKDASNRLKVKQGGR